MESISKLASASEWNTKELCMQSDKLETIETQVKATNGRVTKAEKMIEILSVNDMENSYKWKAANEHFAGCPMLRQEFLDQLKDMKEAKKELEVVGIITKILGNKYGRILTVFALSLLFFTSIYLYHNVPVIPMVFSKVAGLVGL